MPLCCLPYGNACLVGCQLSVYSLFSRTRCIESFDPAVAKRSCKPLQKKSTIYPSVKLCNPDTKVLPTRFYHSCSSITQLIHQNIAVQIASSFLTCALLIILFAPIRNFFSNLSCLPFTCVLFLCLFLCLFMKFFLFVFFNPQKKKIQQIPLFLYYQIDLENLLFLVILK